jgi:hypothetical protein
LTLLSSNVLCGSRAIASAVDAAQLPARLVDSLLQGLDGSPRALCVALRSRCYDFGFAR